MTRVLLLLVAVGCVPDAADTAPPAPRDTAEADAGVLSDEAYRFCHVPGADAEAAREFCELLQGIPPDRCPGFRATCEDGAEEAVIDPAGCNRGSGGPGSSPAPPPNKPDDPFSFEFEPGSCEVPETGLGWFAALMKWTGAILVALLLLVVLRLIVAAIGRWRPDDAGPAVAEVPVEVLVPDADEVPDLPGDDLLQAARRALAEGRWADAVLLSRGASLRQLGDVGRIRLHRARTDREYLRALRRNADVHEPLGEVLGAVEQHRWGGVPVGQDLAARVLAAAERILKLAVLGLALVVLIAAAGDRYRYGPEGDAALFEVLAAHGYDVSWRLRGLASLDDDTDVLVLDLAGINPTDEDWQAIRAWVEDGNLLVVGAFPGAIEALPELGSLVALPAGSETLMDPRLSGLPMPVWPGGPSHGWTGHGDMVWTSTSHAAVVQVARLGAGQVLGIADPRLLWNGALLAQDNEEFLGRMLGRGHAWGYWTLPPDPVSVQLATLSSTGADNPIGALSNAKLLPMVIQLLILVLLGALWRGWPFGPLRDPPDEGRLRFADHVRALGMRYARLGASGHALAGYARLWLQRMGPAGLREAAISAGHDASEADQLVEDLVEASEHPGGRNVHRDFNLMEALWRITKRH